MNSQPVAADQGGILDRPRAAASLAEAMDELLRDVRGSDLPLDIPGVGQARASQEQLCDQLTDHLLPRLRSLSAPVIVVVAGSTGAGKSTLVNSLVGEEVSRAGVLRPTTRQPVLVHHPADTEILADHPVRQEVVVRVSDQVPRGIALLDAPDLDSVDETNRRTAGRLLEAADLWLFVTTAARYGDALPWRVLDGAVGRGATVAMVLNRVDADTMPTVRTDLAARLRERGMQGSPLFVIPDAGSLDGRLPSAVVAPITRWLAMLAGPDRARSVIARTLRGSLDALRPWVDELAEAVQAQADAAEELRCLVAMAVAGPADEARETVDRGAVAQGGLRARWAELASPGEPLADVLRRSGKVDRSASRGRARAVAMAPLVDDLISSLRGTLVAVGRSAERRLRETLRSGQIGGCWAEDEWDRTERSQQRVAQANSAAHRWVDSTAEVASQLAEAAAGNDDRRAAARLTRRVRDARRAVGDEGITALALVAAAGLTPAATLLHAMLGEQGDTVVEELTRSLREVARGAANAERDAVLAVLDQPALAADASAPLRLRLAVIKGMT